MNTITRENLRLLKEEIEQALQPIAEKHNISISGGNASFSDHNASVKLEIATKGESGKEMTKERLSFEANAQFLGLPEEALDSSFSRNGRVYKVIGLKPSSRKYPVLAERDDGKRFKFPADYIRRVFNNEYDENGKLKIEERKQND